MSPQSFDHLIKELTHFKRTWFLQTMTSGGYMGENKGEGCIASPIQWIWFQADPGWCIGTESPSVLQSKSQRVRHGFVTE